MSDDNRQSRFEHPMEHARSLVVRIDPSGTILYINDFAHNFFNCQLSDIIGKYFIGTIIEDTERDRVRLRKIIEGIVDDPESNATVEMNTKRGCIDNAWVAWSFAPFLNNGVLDELLCVGNDISESKKLEHELRETNERFKLMLENVQTGVIIIDPDEHVIMYANHEASRILGIPREEFVGNRCDEWCNGMLEQCMRLDINNDECVKNIESDFERKDGKRIHLYSSAAYIHFKGTSYILASFIDISKQKRTEEKLMIAHRQIEELLSSIVTVLIGVSIDDHVTHWNTAAEELFGILKTDALDKPFPLCPVNWDWRRVFEGIANSILMNSVIKLQSLHFEGRDDREGYLDMTINPILDKTRNITGFILFGEDVTEKQMNKYLVDEIDHRRKVEDKLKKANEDLERLATRDPLTDLNNRRSLMQQLESEFKRAKRYRIPLSLLVMDIDHFKIINDTHGHLIGDKVLVAVAQTLNNVTRETDVSGRYGGEEFCVMLPSTDADRAFITAEKLRIAISKNQFEGVSAFTINCSVGVTELDPSDEDVLSLIRRADTALYEAKDSGRNRCIVRRQNP